MVDIPEHLLKRSQEAKAKAKGEAAPAAEAPVAPEETVPAAAEDAAPPAAEAPAPAATVEPAAAATESVALAATAAAPPAVAATPELPKRYAPASQPTGTSHGYRGAKVPGWLYPTYVLIPILAIGLLLSVVRISNETASSAGPALPGGPEYAAQCAACHGPDGGGGVGPALKETHTVFPDPTEQFNWVKDQANVHSGPYGADNKGNAGKGSTPGAMPKFGGSMSDDQVWDVVIYERVTFAGEDPAIAMKAAGREAPAGAGADAGGGSGGGK